MALILNIETSTDVCSASIANNGKTIDFLEEFNGRSHSSTLTVFVEQLLSKNKINYSDINAVAVSHGPGSYTGLRIGVSVAKGICYALQKPLIAVNTLKTMAIMAKEKYKNIEKKILLCSMIDARRMEVYTSLFNSRLECVQSTKAEIVNNDTYFDLLENNEVCFFGNGAAKFKEIITHKNATFIDNIYASAKYMAILSEEAFNKQDFKDLAYFEPFYLKDFVATKPKKSLLI